MEDKEEDKEEEEEEEKEEEGVHFVAEGPNDRISGTS